MSDLSGPSIVNMQWMDTTSLSEGSLSLSGPFQSYDNTTRYILLLDGFAQCPDGSLEMQVLLNGDALMPARPIKSSNGGSAALSSNTIATCNKAQQDTNGLYQNTLTLAFTWMAPTNVDDASVPSVTAISVSMLPIAAVPSTADPNPSGDPSGEDTPPILL